MKIKYIVFASLLIVAMIFIVYSFQSSLTPYVKIQEAKMSPGRIQVAGLLQANSVKYDRETQIMEFIICEPEGDVLEVHYNGYRRSNLNDVEKVVVIGTYDQVECIFNADEILVKCPSKYEGRLE